METTPDILNKFDYVFKFILLGNTGVGKTSLFLRYFDEPFQEQTVTTIGVDFRVKLIDIDGQKIKLFFWDSAGQERFRALVNTYYKGTHGIIIMFDVNKQESFDSVEFWFREIKKHASENAEVLLVGNKCELEDRQVTAEKAYQLARRLGVDYFEVSAKHNINIGPLIMALTSKVKLKYDRSLDELNEYDDEKFVIVPKDDKIDSVDGKMVKSSKCCY